MIGDIKLNKEVYSKAQFEKLVDTSFNQIEL